MVWTEVQPGFEVQRMGRCLWKTLGLIKEWGEASSRGEEACARVGGVRRKGRRQRNVGRPWAVRKEAGAGAEQVQVRQRVGRLKAVSEGDLVGDVREPSLGQESSEEVRG